MSEELYAQMKQTVIDGEAEEAAALAQKGLDAGLAPGDILANHTPEPLSAEMKAKVDGLVDAFAAASK